MYLAQKPPVASEAKNFCSFVRAIEAYTLWKDDVKFPFPFRQLARMQHAEKSIFYWFIFLTIGFIYIF